MSKEPSISGAVAGRSRDHIADIVGREVFDRAMTKASPADREAYLHATPVGWLPIHLVERMTELVSRESGIPSEKLISDASRLTQEHLLHTVYRVLMRLTTDEWLISRTQALYGRTYDTGKLSSTFPGPGQAIATLTEWPSIPHLQIVGLGVGIETTLRCAGRVDARVVGKRSSGGATYTCTWRK